MILMMHIIWTLVLDALADISNAQTAQYCHNELGNNFFQLTLLLMSM